MKPAAMALLLAAALLAALLAVAAFAPPGVEAHGCDSGTDIHRDYEGTPCTESGHDDPHRNVIQVDGGRDRELEFKVYPPSNRSYLETGDKIEIILAEFDLTAGDFSTETNRDLIAISDSGTPPPDMPAHPSAVVAFQDTLTLTLPNLSAYANGDGEYLIITIEQGTGILTPETPRGFDGEEEGYEVEVTFVDSGGMPPITADDRNIVVVKNPVSSTVPGTQVRIELETYANIEIGSNEEIVVDFSGPSEDASFGLPTTITPSRIKIRSAQTFDPADVLVQRDRVILTVPDDKVVAGGQDFTISISQLARIRNPFAAGNRVITVSTFVPGYEADDIRAAIRRTTTVSPLEGPRGSEFTLEGKGYASGTVTVYYDENGDMEISAGETLASVKTSRGAFRTRLKAGGRLSDAEFRVETVDSYGARHDAVFAITSSVSFEPATVGYGSKLTITLSDWHDNDEELEVAAVRIGGKQAYLAELVKYEHCLEHIALYTPDDNGVVSLEVIVPENVPPGEQTVSIYNHTELVHMEGDHVLDEEEEEARECKEGQARGNLDSGSEVTTRLKDQPNPVAAATIEIVADSLNVSPASAVRGQKITIRGSGVTRSGDGQGDIKSVTINGIPVVEDLAQFEVASNGDYAIIVTVPNGVSDGENEVQVVGAGNARGQGTLTVPEASITLDPAESNRGSEVMVTGAGFVANGLVRLTYGGVGNRNNDDGHIGSALTDSKGQFSSTVKVPVTAHIGREHIVTAVAQADVDGAEMTISAAAGHALPDAVITISPESALLGETITIHGENLPPFVLVGPVKLEGIDVTPIPNVSTDGSGVFEAEVTVPQMELGEAVLRVGVSEVVVTHIIDIAPPPLSGAPARVFSELIEAGVLVRVWRFDPSDQSWAVFDPTLEFADFNTLTEVSGGDFVWVKLTGPHRFQGDGLSPGWNNLFLD